MTFPKKCCQKKSSGKRLLFVSVRKSDGKYKRIYLGDWDDPASHAEYDRRKRLYDESGGQINFQDETGIKYPFTIYQVADKFLTWSQSYYRKNGVETAEPKNLFLSIRPLIDLFGKEPARLFNQTKLKVVQSILDETETICRKQVNKRINHIRRLFRWAAENEYVPIDVVTSLSLLRPLKIGRCQSPERPPVTAVPIEIVNKTLPFLTSVVADMVRLQLLTGCRPEEIRIMRFCDIERTLSDLWHYLPSHDKTEHLRSSGQKKVVSLGPRAIEIISDRWIGLPDDSEEYIFRPIDAYEESKRCKRHDRHTKITPSQSKRDASRRANPKRKFLPYFTTDCYRQAITRACKKAGVPHWHPYQLRHTAATETEKEYGWRGAQIRLGHKSPDTTKIYIDENTSLADQIAKEVG